MADVTITVDGKKITAPAGTLLIEVCKSRGHRDPRLLLLPRPIAAGRLPHVRRAPGKSAQAADRMHHADRRGQVFFTDTPEVVQARKATLQLLLGNHPLDCPVCDAGGECELQDMTFKYGAADSFYAEPKNHREEQQWSPVVYFDRPRCILCYRCVRMCGEGHGRLRAGGGEPRLVVHHRAQRAGAAHAGQSRAPGLRAVRHVHRRLPGGRADQRDLSLQDAAVGDEPRRHRLHPLRRRMQDHAGRALDGGRIARLCAATTATSPASTATSSATRDVTHSTSPTAASASRSRWCASPTAS